MTIFIKNDHKNKFINSSMKINEIIHEKKYCIGTCVNSFDENGNLIGAELPWRDASSFAVAAENAKNISEKEFFKNVTISPEMMKKLSKHQLDYLIADGVYMIYDDNTDVHYFFN